VKCAACGHVFRVYRPEEGPRQWQVRHADGRRVEFKELTTLQRWIVEGRIKRDHEISRDGGTWKPLGEIKELAPFFDVVERAERAERHTGDLLAAPVAPMSSDRSSAMRSHIFSPAELEPIREEARRATDRGDTEPDGVPPRSPSQVGPPPFPASIPAEITGDPPPPPKRSGGAWVALFVLLLGAGGAYAWWSGWLSGPSRGASSLASADAAPASPAGLRGALEPDTADTPPPTPKETPSPEPAPDAPSASALMKKEEPPTPASRSAPPPEPSLRRDARRAVPSAPDFLAAGRRALADEAWTDALDAFGRASELTPEQAEPHAGKGSAYLGLGRADLALDAFRTALRLDPNYVSARLGVGRALLATGDEAGAQLAIQAFLRRAPENHPDRDEAQALLQRGP